MLCCYIALVQFHAINHGLANCFSCYKLPWSQKLAVLFEINCKVATAIKPHIRILDNYREKRSILSICVDQQQQQQLVFSCLLAALCMCVLWYVHGYMQKVFFDWSFCQNSITVTWQVTIHQLLCAHVYGMVVIISFWLRKKGKKGQQLSGHLTPFDREIRPHVLPSL